MKNRKIQILFLTVLFVILIIVLVYLALRYPEIIKLELFIGLIAIFTTLYFSLNKSWLDHDKIFIDLFHQMNTKFDELNEDLNSIREFGKPMNDRNPDAVIQDYLNLCSEEYLWYMKGRIDESVWVAWKAGMNYYLESDIIKSYFISQKPYDVSYYGFINAILKEKKSNKKYKNKA
ncbi:hypothetical protein [Namhaeicola litoreus]|uniref:DUF4760 domain-containing protein n=1 Tax=Namhaeicola litoreus TaxID=1052145 RepID=A0ABW3XXH7_9FLAO